MSDHDQPEDTGGIVPQTPFTTEEPVPAGDKPRWTVEGDFLRINGITHSRPVSGWLANPRMWAELLAQLRSSSEVPALRERLEAAEAVVAEAERFLERIDNCQDPSASCDETYGRPLRQAIARAQGEQK